MPEPAAISRAQSSVSQASICQASVSPASAREGQVRVPAKRASLGRLARRLAHGVAATLLVVITLCLIAFGGLVWRLSQGPLSLDEFAPRINEVLQRRLSGGFAVSLSGAALEKRGAMPTLTVTGLTITDASGREIISAPKAEVDFDPQRLFRPDAGLQRVSLIGPQFKASVSRQGEISLVTAFSPQGKDADAAAPVPAVPSGNPAEAPAQTAAPDASVEDIAGSGHARHGLVATYDDLFGPRGPFKVVTYVGIEDGKILVDDQRSGENITFSNVSASFERSERERVHLSLRGPSGEWSLEAAVERGAGNERRLMVSPKDAPIGDVLLPLMPRALALAPDMPVSGRIDIDILGDGHIKTAQGALTAGAAAWNKPGESSPIMVTDEISAAFSYDGTSRAIEFSNFGVLAGDTDLSVKGHIVPAADGLYAFEFSGANGAVAGATPAERPITLERISLTGTLSPRDATITVSPLELSGKDVSVAMNATYRRGADGGLTLAIQSGRMPARALIALWPPDITKDLRKFMVERLERGIVEHFSLINTYNEAVLAEALAARPVPDETVKLSADVSDVNLRVSDDLPPLTSAAAHIDGTGHTSNITLSAASVDVGDGRMLQVSDGHFQVADTTKKPATAQVSFRVEGGADAFVVAMEHDAPKGAPQAFAPGSISGAGEAHVQFQVTLRDGVKPKDVPLTVQGTLSKLMLQDVGAGQKLENAQLAFAIASGVMTGKGEGRFAGAPATIEFRKDAGDANPQIRLAMTLDDAARAKLGLRAGRAITGPMPVKIQPAMDPGAAQTFDVEADLTRTAIDGFIPGWTKAAGRAGKLTFRMSPGDDQTRFSKINLASAPVAVTGEVIIAKDGSLVSGKFDSFKVSPGDELRVDIAKGDGNIYKTAVKGQAIDLRPFIKSFMSGSQTDTQDADLDLKAASAIGFGDEKGTGLDLHLSRRGQGLTDFHFAGQVGKADVSGTISREGRPLITIQAGDAGAFLRFMDLYRHMNSGTMVLRLTPSVGSQAGAVSIRDFSLRNEEALARIFAAAPPPRNGTDGPVAPLTAGEAQFNRLQGSFLRNAGRLDIREALIVGNQAGITLSGPLDFARNTTNLTGTFVPAYGLNNAFSKVPLFGPLLSGGSNEGLLGVNFHVSGSLAQPDVSVNPLSAITPGFLRKLFDIGSPGARDFEPDATQKPTGVDRSR